MLSMLHELREKSVILTILFICRDLYRSSVQLYEYVLDAYSISCPMPYRVNTGEP